MAKPITAASSPPLLLHFLRPPPTPPPSFSPLLSFLLFKPLTVIPLHSPPRLHFTYSRFTSLPSGSLLFHLPRSLSTTISSHLTLEPEIEDNLDDEEFETGNKDLELGREKVVGHVEDRDLNSSPSKRAKELGTTLLTLSVKERKELTSYAQSLGKKLKSQQVGKWGVTDSVATALVETLDKRELLKLKIHNNCPGELDDVVKHLEQATRSVVVFQIGRTVILYRPSLTKLKAVEKMEQARKVFRRKPLKFKQPFKKKMQDKGRRPRISGRGRRGSSRFSSSP